MVTMISWVICIFLKFYLDREGKEPGCYQLRWSPLFPDVLIPECGLMQADITIRKGVNKFNKSGNQTVITVLHLYL